MEVEIPSDEAASSPPQHMHIFATHAQAWDNETAVAARFGQFGELNEFIASLNIPSTEPGECRRDGDRGLNGITGGTMGRG